MARHDTDLPFGDAFGPNQLDTPNDEPPELAYVLELAKKHEGQEDQFDEAIRQTFFPDDDDLTRAKNVRLGLKHNGYGLTNEDFYLTDLGEELYDLRKSPQEMYNRFAQHILQELHGLKIIEIIEDLEAQGKSTTNANIKKELRNQYDFHIDKTSNHWSQMRGWLSKADIVNTGTHHYEINRTKIEELIGLESDEIIELDGLTDQQQAFLRALTILPTDREIKSRIVRKVAEEAYGVEIKQSNISRRTLDPLSEAGYLEWEHVSGKPNRIETTDQFDGEILRPVLEDLAERTGVPRRVLRLSFDEILEDLDSDSTHEKGVALETLAIKLGRILGLDFVGWRVRGRETGGSEVDVVMDDIGTTYNRWQIQCKNTKKQIETGTVAREVGISRILQTNTILMVARGGVSPDAQQYANRVMRHENLAIMFLSGEEIEKIDESADHLLTVLQGEARRIHNTKRLSQQEVEEDQDQELVEREEQALEKFADEIEESKEGQGSLSDFT